jgi:hypothetical protein
MSRKSNGRDRSVVWSGRPWIFPWVLARTILFIAITIFIFWLELYFVLAFTLFVNVPLIYWTSLVLFVAWILSLGHLLILKYSNKYVLRTDSLEVKGGIASLTSFIITSSGFSDLQVNQSLFERAINSGEIVIFSQSERNFQRKMVRVKNPMKVAEQIRFVMGRPIVRMEGTEEGHQPDELRRIK